MITTEATKDHAASVAGLLVAHGDDEDLVGSEKNMAGMAWNCPLYSYDTWDTKKGNSYDGFSVAAGIDACFKNRTFVVNLSQGYQVDFFYRFFMRRWRNTIKKAVREAARQDGLVVMSAGNKNITDDDKLLPFTTDSKYAEFFRSNAIIVGSAFTYESPHQDFHTTHTRGRAVDIFAPGVSITTSNVDGSELTTADGTSFASPIVAGTIALMASELLERDLPIWGDRLKRTLLATAINKDKNGALLDPPFLDAGAAVAACARPGVPFAKILAPNDQTSTREGDKVSFLGRGTDAEDGGVLFGRHLVWESDRMGRLSEGNRFTSTLSPGEHEITLTVTDNDGNSFSDTVSVTVTEVADRLSFFAPQDIDAGPEPTHVATDDLNGDEIPDLVVTNFPSTVSVLLGRGDGSSSEPAHYARNIITTPLFVSIADFNADDIPDLAVAAGISLEARPFLRGGIFVLIGRGDGTFGEPETYDVGTMAIATATGDFDADGAIDIVVASQIDASVWILPGRGDGSFTEAVPYEAGGEPHYVAVSDLNPG